MAQKILFKWQLGKEYKIFNDLVINDSNNEAKEDITNFETLTLNKWID